MSDNYPPGVSGMEFQIAGADREWEEDRFCGECGKVTPHSMASYRSQAWGNCEECDTAVSVDLDDERDDPDPRFDDEELEPPDNADY